MKLIYLWISAGLLGVVIIGVLWLLPADMEMGDMSVPAAQQAGERKPLYWVGPMDANLRRSEPGFDPMGMPLIPVYESGDTITVSSSIQQNLGVRTATVVREDFIPVIAAVGYAGWDQSSIEMLHTRAEGWLEVFNLASVGDRVRTGEVIYELFAPNLVSVQREYLTARDSANRQLTAIARDRLLALGFTPEQVEQLDRSATVSNRLVVSAQRDSIITHIGVRQGNFVEPNTLLASLASLDSVWIETQVFESKAGWVEPGLPAQVSFAAYPGETWNSRIAYIYPDLEATTRSLRLRLLVENRDHRLRPNMFASVTISARPRPGVLSVPREAVIRAGSGDRVIVALGEGRFQPQIVKTGIASGSRIEILSGLNEGDSIVTSGQFLLDSEANGEQAFARLAATDAGSTAGTSQSAAAMVMDMPATASATTVANARETETSYSTTGVIRQVVAGTSVTIAHQPVAALGWPAMVMAFRIPSQMNIGELAVGDAVAFEFVITPEGAYQLATITAQDGAR
jgi:membrane fusion protein, copper/silver efflux system